jgi:hypothetical protein
LELPQRANSDLKITQKITTKHDMFWNLLQQNNTTNLRRSFFPRPYWIKTLPLLAVHWSTTVGKLAARAKTNSPKEQLQKPLQNLKFPIPLFMAPGSLFGGLILLEIGDSEHSPLGFYYCRPPNLQWSSPPTNWALWNTSWKRSSWQSLEVNLRLPFSNVVANLSLMSWP